MFVFMIYHVYADLSAWLAIYVPLRILYLFHVFRDYITSGGGGLQNLSLMFIIYRGMVIDHREICIHYCTICCDMVPGFLQSHL
jgi:hypothetical protein